ncbi:MAG: HAD family hydrolase [Anaerolineaceae bacterium]|nr:HAD family hydrolase [Anaerolineaceae bacterium]
MLKAVLFDLDGTLLPMDQDKFVKGYFQLLAKKLAPYGYEPNMLINAVWHGTTAMINNDGSCTNEDVFWKDFTKIFGEQARSHEPIFAEFYEKDFQQIKNICGYTPKAAETVYQLKKAGIRTALATNPVFPAVATESRIRWAGLTPEDFELYTTYENIGYCKPNPAYYLEILSRMGLAPEDCLMVGNDVEEDMIAERLGMKVFLLTDCLINKNGADINSYPHGNFDDLKSFLL